VKYPCDKVSVKIHYQYTWTQNHGGVCRVNMCHLLSATLARRRCPHGTSATRTSLRAVGHTSQQPSYDVDAGCWCCCSSSSSCDGVGSVACVSSSVSALSSSSNESLRIWSLKTDEHACVKICAVMHVQIHLHCIYAQYHKLHPGIVQSCKFSVSFPDNSEQLPMRPDPKLMSWHQCVLHGQKYQSGIDKKRPEQ